MKVSSNGSEMDKSGVKPGIKQYMDGHWLVRPV